ncbi:sulfite exporter TauE/SafE family protein [Methylocella silvestris]|uniref:Probable membrane transporter protein n=1 Tax=Methylocella silvestris TaxID=199596 RepID=A0A2J7TDU1_METSI|nr:sulfite exporter TauE/SafE family protein [Methylocella silvestris]PNG24931.1 hypothetical protein CR492_16415 [Methylocella silvestris]
MTPVDMLLSIAIALVSGIFIGCIGIGGVLIVPALIYLTHIGIYTAIAAAICGYIFTGLVGTLMFMRNGTLDWARARVLCAGAMPAAIIGSLTVKATSPIILQGAIAILTVSSGVQALIGRPAHVGEPTRFDMSNRKGVLIGVFTGFLSALTGTGGPVVLIPILLALRAPVLTSIGLAQAIQLPIALPATVANAAAGTLDPLLGGVLGLGLAAGTWCGAWLAHKLNQAVLRRLVALVLLGTGGLMLFKLVLAASQISL